MSVNFKVVSRTPPNASYSEKNKSSMDLIKKFFSLVKEHGLIKELRERRFYEKPCDKKRREKLQRQNAIVVNAAKSKKEDNNNEYFSFV